MVVKKVNAGKIFEANFKDSVANCGEDIFFYRIKDVNLPPELRTKVKIAKNDYDCFMFARGHLFTLELKSTKEKNISFSESIIKQHQIDNLLKASKYPGVISGFIFNFREPENRVFFIQINDFIDYKYVAENQIKPNIYKNKINRSSIPLAICEEIGMEIKGFKKRTNWHYHVRDFITEAINTYEENNT